MPRRLANTLVRSRYRALWKSPKAEPTVDFAYFQWPPCSPHTDPVLLHVLQVNLPPMPLARPPLHAWQSCTGREHFRHFMVGTSLLRNERPTPS